MHFFHFTIIDQNGLGPPKVMTITVNVKTQKGDNAIKHGSYHSINGGRATCSELLLILESKHKLICFLLTMQVYLRLEATKMAWGNSWGLWYAVET